MYPHTEDTEATPSPSWVDYRDGDIEGETLGPDGALQLRLFAATDETDRAVA